jgi:SAM-dependent methyltransferase
MEKILNRIIIFIVLILVTSLLGYFFKSSEEDTIEENFADIGDEHRVTRKTPYEIYDKFYSSIYDELFLNKLKNEFEIYNIELNTIKEPKQKSLIKKEDIRFLDIGCGTGKHLEILLKKGYKCDGVDLSPSMLKVAKKNIAKYLPNFDSKLIEADITHDTSVLSSRKYSHVTCMFFTIYYIKDVTKLFKSIHDSLKHGGYMCIHLVNKQKFDPVLEKSSNKLIPLFNPQKHSATRVTKSKLVFNKFNYISDWIIKENSMDVEFHEQFIFKKQDRRLIKNEHKFFMRNIPYYTGLAKKCGFELIRVVDLLPVGHDNSYIFIFRRRLDT